MPSARDYLEHRRRLNAPAVALYWSTTEAQFHEAVERLFHKAIRELEGGRAEYRVMGEVGLSKHVTAVMGDDVPAVAEGHSNGHVDITVDHPRGLAFRYLTECKIWRGFDKYQPGMLQIVGYATKQERRVMCLAFFIEERQMLKLMGRLRGKVDAATELPIVSASLDHGFLPGGFVSHHEHQSGAIIQVVHAGCDLFQAAI